MRHAKKFVIHFIPRYGHFKFRWNWIFLEIFDGKKIFNQMNWLHTTLQSIARQNTKILSPLSLKYMQFLNLELTAEAKIYIMLKTALKIKLSKSIFISSVTHSLAWNIKSIFFSFISFTFETNILIPQFTTHQTCKLYEHT